MKLEQLNLQHLHNAETKNKSIKSQVMGESSHCMVKGEFCGSDPITDFDGGWIYMPVRGENQTLRTRESNDDGGRPAPKASEDWIYSFN